MNLLQKILIATKVAYKRINKLFNKKDIKCHSLKTQYPFFTVDNNLRDEKTGDVLERQKKIRRSTARGTSHRHVIQTVMKDGYEFSYHATKGWRKSRVFA